MSMTLRCVCMSVTATKTTRPTALQLACGIVLYVQIADGKHLKFKGARGSNASMCDTLIAGASCSDRQLTASKRQRQAEAASW